MLASFEKADTSLIKPVYDKLKAMILDGELAPKEKIRQEKTALKLGISRTPLVKALKLLEQELLVENLPRRGIYVRDISLDELLEAFECRLAVESTAARLAAERISEKQVKELKRIFSSFRTSGNIVSSKYQSADELFHKKVLEASRNRYLSRMFIVGNILSKTYQKGLIREPEETLPEHESIIEAISFRDPELAEELMKNHILKTVEVIKEEIENKLNSEE